MKSLRKDINNWVAKYRREPKVAGKPSFGYAVPQDATPLLRKRLRRPAACNRAHMHFCMRHLSAPHASPVDTVPTPDKHGAAVQSLS